MPSLSNEVWCTLRWQRSRRGNLWQRLDDGTVLAVFKRRFGLPYGWSIYDAEYDETEYSRQGFSTEKEAAEAVVEVFFSA